MKDVEIMKKLKNELAIMLFALTGLSLQISAADSLPLAYQPDRGFLKSDPYKKSKSRVELSGIKNESELTIVKEAINDTLQLIRIFGPGNILPDGRIILDNTRMHPSFLKLTTEQGRREIDIEPASTRLDKKIYNWNIISDDQLEVDVIFKHQPLSLGPSEVPDEKTYRLGFIKNKCGAKWCLNTAKRIK
ncbi:hypothetical protein [Limnohabitans sp. Rim8]|uniref:hypothetical protein n=1 Tax=Limnohabitans sp. Rim8 TaxID=1100718 RepID=UPI0033064A91